MQPRNYTAELDALIKSKKFKISDAMKLIRKGADPNVQNDDGNTFLHILVMQLARCKASQKDKYFALIEKLVRKFGANINIKNDDGFTPLQWLMKDTFHPDSAKKLKELGAIADLNIYYYIDSSQLIKDIQIGEGAFGDVYSGKWIKEKTKDKSKVKSKEKTQGVVIKEMVFIDMDCKKQYASYCNEVSILQAMTEANAPNVIAYFGFNMQKISQYRTAYRIVMEDGMYSLEDILKASSNSLDWGTRDGIIVGMINGVEFIHSCNILHRDLKSANILIDGEMKSKIADFGLACKESESNGIAGTLLYMPPELLDYSGGSNSKMTDVYSLGCPINEVISGNLIQTKDPRPVIKKPAECSTQKFTLFLRCWEKDPKARPTMKQLKEATTLDQDHQSTVRNTKSYNS